MFNETNYYIISQKKFFYNNKKNQLKSNTIFYNIKFKKSKTIFLNIKLKVSFYIAQYPVLRTVQSALHFTSLIELLN